MQHEQEKVISLPALAAVFILSIFSMFLLIFLIAEGVSTHGEPLRRVHESPEDYFPPCYYFYCDGKTDETDLRILRGGQ